MRKARVQVNLRDEDSVRSALSSVGIEIEYVDRSFGDIVEFGVQVSGERLKWVEQCPGVLEVIWEVEDHLIEYNPLSGCEEPDDGDD